MSHSFSKVIDYQGDYYKEGDWSPSTSRYMARIHFHHTSDTVSWQRTDPLAENMRSMFKDRLVMSNEEYDALVEAIKSELEGQRTDQPSQPQPQSPSQPGLLPESQTRHLTDPGIAD